MFWIASILYFQGTELYNLTLNTINMTLDIIEHHLVTESNISSSYFFDFLKTPGFSEDFNVGKIYVLYMHAISVEFL